MDSRRPLAGWGRTNPSVATVHPAGDDAELARLVTEAGRRGVLARGLGRSYGDAAQNGGGVVVDMTARSGVLLVDTGAALVEVEAGASLDHLMRLLLPMGLFVPVSPGTRQVTVGGAIAADIHGKNHHVDGSFGRHVVSMDLLCADGTIRQLTPESELFWATIGGMGLTGLVLRATLRMKKVESAYCLVDTERCTDLNDLLQRMADGDHRYTYSVAWIDCLARGSSLGRSVLTRGRSATLQQLAPALRDHALDFRPKQLAVAPSIFPSGLLSRATVSAFNEAWYRKAPRERRGEIQSIAAFFHPLDAVAQWNRIYGPRVSCSTSSSCLSAPRTLSVAASRCSVTPVRPRSWRCSSGSGSPAPATCPFRHPDGPLLWTCRSARRSWVDCSTAWTRRSLRPGAASTSPRTPGCRPPRSRECILAWMSGATSNGRRTPMGSSILIWLGGWDFEGRNR